VAPNTIQLRQEGRQGRVKAVNYLRKREREIRSRNTSSDRDT
jgi:hypothetical protein